MQALQVNPTSAPDVLRSQLGVQPSLQKNREYCRFSESALWSAQRQYFQSQGINPWRNNKIPFYATSNPLLARSYAKMVVEFWQDAIASGSVDTRLPMPIIEMGCGSGTFTFLFLSALEAELEQSAIGGATWVLICTDLSEVNGRYIINHPKLRRFVQEGKLEVGCFDVETQSVVNLSSGHTLTTFTNPCVAIANYLFDSLTQDLFHLHYGALYEAQVGLGFHHDEAVDESSARAVENHVFEADSPFNNMEVDYRWSPVRSMDWLSSPVQDQILSYASSFESSVLLYPTGAIHCISHLQSMAKNGLLILAADKGFCSEQSARLQEVPVPSVQGSFSLPVNFNALDRYCESQGGLSWFSQHRDDGLVYAAMIFSPKVEMFGNTQSAFYTNFESNSPDHIIPIVRGLQSRCEDSGRGEFSLPEMLSYIQLAGYCPRVLELFTPYFLDGLLEEGPSFKARFGSCLKRVWGNTFPLGGSGSWLFDFGAIALDSDEWELAETIYRYYIEYEGREPASYYNLSLVYANLALWDKSKQACEQAIQLMLKNNMATAEEEELLQSSVKLKEYCDVKLQAYLCSISPLAQSERFVEPSCDPSAQASMSDVFLTPIDTHFSAAIFHQFRDHNISTLTRLPEFECVNDVREWIEEQEAYSQKKLYCVVHKTKGFVGLVGVHVADRAGYFFFCMGTDYQNRGFGSQALALLKNQCVFLGVNTLFSGVYSENRRSLAVLAKHHFQPLSVVAEAPDEELSFHYLDLQVLAEPNVDIQPRGSAELSSVLAELLLAIHSPIKLDTH